MKIKSIISSFIMIFTIIYTNPCNSFSKKIDDQLENRVQTLMDEHNIPGVVIGVWIPGKGEWVSALGVADKKTKEKMTINDHFRVGSITKTFTATALLQLVDQGKLSLDDKIGKYVENVPNGNEITLRQLANMTSGLPNYSENDTWVREMLEDRTRVWTPKELLKAAFSQPILFKPGEKFYYCNTNYILLELVIEKISGIELNEYLEKNIFEPLNLTNTSFPLDNKIPKPFSHGYSKQTLTGVERDVTFESPSWAFSAGAIISNLHDLKIWAEALGTGKLLNKKAFEERLQWVPEDKMPPSLREAKGKYGLGIASTNGWLLHNGDLPGYNSVAAYLPAEKAIFVCLVNMNIPTKRSRPSPKVHKDLWAPAMLIYTSITKILFPKNISEIKE